MEKKSILLVVLVVAVLVVAAVAASLILNGSDGNTVRYVTVPPTQMGDWLQQGDGSAFIAWEPYASSSIVDGTGRALMWTSEIMQDHPCCVVVLSTDFASTGEGTDLAKRFLKAHVEATEWILETCADKESAEYDLLVNMSIDFTLRDAAVVESALEHVTYQYEMSSNFTDALEQFTEMYIDTGIVTDGALGDLGYDNITDFVDDYVDESLLAELDTVTPSDTILNPDDPIRLGYLAGDIHQLAQVVAGNASVLGNGKSLFEEYGLSVESAPGAPYANGGAEMNAFIAGHVDIGYLGAPPAILNKLNADADTIIIAQVNSEGSAIVVPADSDIETLDDLAGKLVATPGESSIQHLLLKIALKERGFRLAMA